MIAAYRFTPGGLLLHPDHDRTYRDLVRRHEIAINPPVWRRGFDLVEADEARGDVTRARRNLEGLVGAVDGPDIEAALRLATGRLVLEQGDLVAAEATARELLRCCGAVREEYGVSFGLYAAAQLVTAWRRQGVLPARFGSLAEQLGGLLDQGVIGHPVDVPRVVSLAAPVGPSAEADALVARTREAASRISAQAAAGHELERWVAASTLVARSRQDMILSTLFSDGQPRLVGVFREPGGQFLALSFSTDRLASWIAARASGRGRFEATLAVSAAEAAAGAIRVRLSPDTPGLDLVLRPPAMDPALQQNRTALLGGLFAAAFLLLLIVAWLTLRDISRELRVASLRANFVAGVTHELKTPLTSIRLLAETLRLKRTRDPAAADELLCRGRQRFGLCGRPVWSRSGVAEGHLLLTRCTDGPQAPALVAVARPHAMGWSRARAPLYSLSSERRTPILLVGGTVGVRRTSRGRTRSTMRTLRTRAEVRCTKRC